MKRITSIILILFLVFGMSCFAVVFAQISPENSQLMKDAPRKFNAYGFEHIVSGEVPPFHRLHMLMDIEFINGKEVHEQYTVEFSENSIYGPAIHTLDLYLTYDRDALKDGLPFISGTFTYYWDRNNNIKEYSGTVKGTLIEISPATMEFVTDYSYTNSIALDLDVEGDPWDWTIYLEVPGEETYYMNAGHIKDGYSSDYYHEERPHVPTPSKQADVAAGVGLSTAGIAIANALTKTSIFGSASFNGTLGPVAPGVPPSAPAPVNTSASSGFLGAIKNFIKNLFSGLRDMLTDEGRSYASGKMADFLEDTDIENIIDEN